MGGDKSKGQKNQMRKPPSKPNDKSLEIEQPPKRNITTTTLDFSDDASDPVLNKATVDFSHDDYEITKTSGTCTGDNILMVGSNIYPGKTDEELLKLWRFFCEDDECDGFSWT